MKCPHCNKEIKVVKTYYEIYNGDGGVLKNQLDGTLTDIVKGEKEIVHYESFECPHCKAYLSLKIELVVKEVELELESEPDED